MTKEQVMSVCNTYLRFITKAHPGHNWRPRVCTDDMMGLILNPDLKHNGNNLTNELMEHLLYMCEQTIRFCETDELEKAFRWLGFIQGAFWILGIFSINDMRDQNTR